MSTGLKTLFLVHAIIGFVLGAVLYLAPGTWAAMVNWTPFDPTLTQVYGAALLALGLSSVLAYRATRWEEVRIIVQMEIAYTVLGALISLYGALVTGAPAFIWVSVVLFAALAVAWITFYRQAPA